MDRLPNSVLVHVLSYLVGCEIPSVPETRAGRDAAFATFKAAFETGAMRGVTVSVVDMCALACASRHFCEVVDGLVPSTVWASAFVSRWPDAAYILEDAVLRGKITIPWWSRCVPGPTFRSRGGPSPDLTRVCLVGYWAGPERRRKPFRPPFFYGCKRTTAESPLL